MRRHRAAPFLALPVVVLASACTGSSQDATGWREDTRRALSDVAGQVETTRLAVDQESRGRMLGGYTLGVVTDAEDAAARGTETVSASSPPASAGATWADVVHELAAAEELIARTRMALADGDAAAYAGLGRRLEDTGKALDRREKDLE